MLEVLTAKIFCGVVKRMHHFHYVKDELFCEEVPVAEVAQAVGTPLYLYSHATLLQHIRAFEGAFEGLRHLTCFSMKSNSNAAVLKLLQSEGCGADIVSGGELYRALRAGIDPQKIVYSGVGKRINDLEYALRAGILMFNAESQQEILNLDQVASRLGVQARLSIRINPDVDPKTHPHISTGLREHKFGIDIEDAPEQYTMAAGLKNLKICGVSCHIGSQVTEVGPFVDALKRLVKLIGRLQNAGIVIEYLDLGGGLGITYDHEHPPHPTEYAEALRKELPGSDLILILEPGRVIVGNAGILVTKLLYTKHTKGKTFYIVDAAMNDLMRPVLYNSYHAIQPVKQSARPGVTVDVVGPICESGDFLAKQRTLQALEPQELMALMSAGAYGFSMSSNYNSRPRPAEVLVKGDRFYTIRARETYEDLVRGERLPDFLE